MDAERLRLLLPEVYQSAAWPGSPLSATLEVMADLHEPVERVLADFPSVIDPWRTPDRFVPYLARWVGLEGWLDTNGELATGIGRLRLVIAAAAQLQQSRGTTAGLRHALVLALGEPDVQVQESVPGPDGRPVPFTVRVTVPSRVWEQRALVERIVAEEKAAHAVVEIVVAEGSPAPHSGEQGGGP